MGCELLDYDVEGAEGRVGHYYGVDYHSAEEHFLCALGSVAHAEDELEAD